MIHLLRVDHRLLHGQVAFSWVKNLGCDCILIANDKVINDEVYKTTLKLAKPEGCKLVIKDIKSSIEAINSGVTEKYQLIIVVENIKDGYEIAKNCNIKSINLGGTKASENTKNISKAVNITSDEEKLLNELCDKNIEIEIRQLPLDKKILYRKEEKI